MWNKIVSFRKVITKACTDVPSFVSSVSTLKIALPLPLEPTANKNPSLGNNFISWRHPERASYYRIRNWVASTADHYLAPACGSFIVNWKWCFGIVQFRNLRCRQNGSQMVNKPEERKRTMPRCACGYIYPHTASRKLSTKQNQPNFLGNRTECQVAQACGGRSDVIHSLGSSVRGPTRTKWPMPPTGTVYQRVILGMMGMYQPGITADHTPLCN